MHFIATEFLVCNPNILLRKNESVYNKISKQLLIPFAYPKREMHFFPVKQNTNSKTCNSSRLYFCATIDIGFYVHKTQELNPPPLQASDTNTYSNGNEPIIRIQAEHCHIIFLCYLFCYTTVNCSYNSIQEDEDQSHCSDCRPYEKKPGSNHVFNGTVYDVIA